MMKIIDLLNKIANGEEVPKKIQLGEKEYEYVDRVDGLYNYKNTFNGDYLSNEFMIENILNFEVEIIEEEKILVCGTYFTKEQYDMLFNHKEDNKKIEKLNIDDIDYFTMNNKINEIIDKLNEGDK